MKIGRKTIICKECNKEAYSYGFGFCSACLRLYKRRTRPSFYLGTCYSEISRRCKTFDPIRPNYQGKMKCTKEEFFNKFENDENFLDLYKNWQERGFKRKYAPSIDRINNEGDYTLDNIQFIVHRMNGKKDWQYNIELSKGDTKFVLESQKKTAEFLGVCPAVICIKFREGDTIEFKGWTLKRINA
jgi:hypothetical protein